MEIYEVEHWDRKAPLVCYCGTPVSNFKSRRCWTELSNEKDFRRLPYSVPGVYVLYSASEVVYVGQSGNVRSRIQYHRRRFRFDRAKISINESGVYRLELERLLLVRLRPKKNGVVPTSVKPWFLQLRLS